MQQEINEKPGLSSTAELASSKPVFDVVAIATSAGGLHALSILFSELPADFTAPILVVQHLDRRYPSHMAEILSRRTRLKVMQATTDSPLYPGTVYIAPSDHHLIVNTDGRLELTSTAPVHFSRPSADLLFESVAAYYKNRAIGVILTGMGCDGTRGIKAIKAAGGKIIVQDEASSAYFSMPSAAIDTGQVDYILPLESIGASLASLVITGELP